MQKLKNSIAFEKLERLILIPSNSPWYQIAIIQPYSNITLDCMFVLDQAFFLRSGQI